jgi:putative oxidoreductase
MLSVGLVAEKFSKAELPLLPCCNLFVLPEVLLRYLHRLQPLALLVLRAVLGAIMIGHGYSKVFGGLSEHVHHVSNLGLPGWLAYFSAAAEFVGGMLVIAGLFTRVAALAILINMSVAIWKVHWKNGLLGQNGYQFPLSLVAIAFALIFFGAGPIALDGVWRSASSRGNLKK